MTILTCPNCGAALEIEEHRRFAFCQYCGTKVTNINNSVEIDRYREIENLLLRAIEFEYRRDYTRATEYCSRVLDLDPTNVRARELERRLPVHSAGPNVEIIYRSSLNDRFKLRITMDGKKWNTLEKDEILYLELPKGRHRIIFSGKKDYKYDLVITDIRKPIRIVYTAGRGRNTIECDTGE